MIISRTPLRMSFGGGGSDLSVYYKTGHGSVVSTTINKYIYITVNKKFDDLIRVCYSKNELVESVDDIEHNIIREAMKIVGIEKGIEIVYMGDIPLGSAGIGLGSSSSLAVGVLNALYAYKGEHASAEKLAQEACKIEIEILKNPIGKQDQYAAAYGGFNHIQFNADESVFVDPIICDPKTKEKLKGNLMLFFTGLERISSNILCEQKEKTHENLEYLDKIVGLSEEIRKNLLENNLAGFGEILHKGWMSKKKLASLISNSHIDEVYSKAINAGAIGGKILGAGGGGFVLLYCDNGFQGKVRSVLSNMMESTFQFEPQGSKIIYVSE
ncbi:MAG: GHMP kinase [Deltaproteobacteria bacterium]|nr:GHMP kinase [Deltaproteobacteria bacterium]